MPPPNQMSIECGSILANDSSQIKPDIFLGELPVVIQTSQMEQISQTTIKVVISDFLLFRNS